MNLFLAEIESNSALISDGEAHHLNKVLRKNIGDSIMVTDGQGKIYSGEINSISSKNVTVSNLNKIEYNQKRNYTIEIAVAPTKQIDRIEFFLEKSVEIGLDEMYPIITFHSERRKINHDRLERVAISAMKQSLKAELPKVNHLINFKDFVDECRAKEGQKFIAHCYSDLEKKPLKEILEKNNHYIFMIGPEGDFSKDEVLYAIENGFHPITLGNQRMRTETAALSCVSGVHWMHQ